MAVLPVPVIVRGEPEMWDIRGYWPGDPLPPIIHSNAGVNFQYNRAQDAYLQVPVRPRQPVKESYSAGDIAGGIIVGCISLMFLVFLIGLLWWIIIPALVIAGIVKLVQVAARPGGGNWNQYNGD